MKISQAKSGIIFEDDAKTVTRLLKTQVAQITKEKLEQEKKAEAQKLHYLQFVQQQLNEHAQQPQQQNLGSQQNFVGQQQQQQQQIPQHIVMQQPGNSQPNVPGYQTQISVQQNYTQSQVQYQQSGQQSVIQQDNVQVQQQYSQAGVPDQQLQQQAMYQQQGIQQQPLVDQHQPGLQRQSSTEPVQQQPIIHQQQIQQQFVQQNLQQPQQAEFLQVHEQHRLSTISQPDLLQTPAPPQEHRYTLVYFTHQIDLYVHSINFLCAEWIHVLWNEIKPVLL